jgi:PEP-CTERM motif
MSKSVICKIIGTAALLGAATAAQASFIEIDEHRPYDRTINIVHTNNFRSQLAGLGITSYTLGASLGTSGAGSVTYYYYGKEAGYRNDFWADDLSYSTGFNPTYQNRFGNPYEIGTVDVDGGLLDFGFCAYSSSYHLVDCLSNRQNDRRGLGSFQSIAMSIIGDSAWLFWDDSGAGPDDNHDDMIIRAVFTPATTVPEPATLALFGLGLMAFGLTRMRRKKA